MSCLRSPQSPLPLVSLVGMCLALVALTGCGGGGAAGGGTTSGPADTTVSEVPNYHSPSEWIVLIEQAGLADHAALGRELVADGKVIMVSPPTLDESYNAYTWIADREIWINRPLFSRYSDVVDQAEIFVHELIHISSQEVTHDGPWWSDLQVYRNYWASR